MSAPRYARLASRILAPSDRPTPVPAPEPDARAAAVAAVAGAIRKRARERRVRSWAVSLAMVAAVAAAALGTNQFLAGRAGRSGAVASVVTTPSTPTGVRIVAHAVGSGPAGAAPGTRAPLADGWELAAGSRVVAPTDGGVLFSFSTGTSAVLHEGTDLSVLSVSSVQVLRIDSGSVDFHVAKLAGAERFLVDTPDAEVEVRGTQFNVSIVSPEPSCGAGTRTRVTVTEGVVVVRHGRSEERVGANEQWPSRCGPSSGPAAILATDLPRAAPVPGGSVASARSSPSPSSLAEQNALFASAVAARRRGDTRGALAALDHFLAIYPSSALEESATVERMRLLRSSSPGRVQAAAAARDYLTRYPGGFARPEAEAVLAGAP